MYYFRENPGVPTSHISKLMGQHWRNLRPSEQQPYRYRKYYFHLLKVLVSVSQGEVETMLHDLLQQLNITDFYKEKPLVYINGK